MCRKVVSRRQERAGMKGRKVVEGWQGKAVEQRREGGKACPGRQAAWQVCKGSGAGMVQVAGKAKSGHWQVGIRRQR